MLSVVWLTRRLAILIGLANGPVSPARAMSVLLVLFGTSQLGSVGVLTELQVSNALSSFGNGSATKPFPSLSRSNP